MEGQSARADSVPEADDFDVRFGVTAVAGQADPSPPARPVAGVDDNPLDRLVADDESLIDVRDLGAGMETDDVRVCALGEDPARTDVRHRS